MTVQWKTYQKWVVFCEETVVKLVVIFLKKPQEQFFNKADAFLEGLQQRLINNRNIWWSFSRLSVGFVSSENTYISRLGIVKDSSDCFWPSNLFLIYRQFWKKKKKLDYWPLTHWPTDTDPKTRWIINHIWKTWQ